MKRPIFRPAHTITFGPGEPTFDTIINIMRVDNPDIVDVLANSEYPLSTILRENSRLRRYGAYCHMHSTLSRLEQAIAIAGNGTVELANIENGEFVLQLRAEIDADVYAEQKTFERKLIEVGPLLSVTDAQHKIRNDHYVLIGCGECSSMVNLEGTDVWLPRSDERCRSRLDFMWKIALIHANLGPDKVNELLQKAKKYPVVFPEQDGIVDSHVYLLQSDCLDVDYMANAAAVSMFAETMVDTGILVRGYIRPALDGHNTIYYMVNGTIEMDGEPVDKAHIKRTDVLGEEINMYIKKDESVLTFID